MGEMLHASWESLATTLANADSPEALISALEAIINAHDIDLAAPATVVYGHDTRPSCPVLVKSLEDGLDAMGVNKLAAGLVTTPQLHYLVRCYNTLDTPESYGEPTEQGYYSKLASAYMTLAVSLIAQTVDHQGLGKLLTDNDSSGLAERSSSASRPHC